MNFYKVDGVWSTSENPKNRVAGTLSYTEKGLKLKLLGSFRKGWSPTSDYNYPIIQGVVEKNDYGSFVTLYDSFTTRSTINSSGIGAEQIRVNKAVLGDDHAANIPQEYNYISFRYTHLQDWVGWLNFDVDHRSKDVRESVIRYTRPENINFKVGEKTYKIASSHRTTGIGSNAEASIRQRTHLLVEPIGIAVAEKVSMDFFYDMQNLISFATDTPNAVDEIMLSSGEYPFEDNRLPKHYHLFFNPLFRTKGEPKRRFQMDMLFDLNDARNANLNIFQRWCDFSNEFRDFCVLYFAHTYRRPKFLDERFQSLVTSLSLFCTRAFGNSQRSASATSELHSLLTSKYNEREMLWLTPVLNIQSQLDLPFQLSRLLDEHKSIISNIIRSDFNDIISLVCSLVGNYGIRLKAVEDGTISSRDIIFLMDKLRWLLKVAILKELGFDESAVDKLTARNKTFNDLKSV